MRRGLIKERSNLYVIGVPKGQAGWNGTEAIFEEVMAMNFSKLMKDLSNFSFRRHCKPLAQEIQSTSRQKHKHIQP